MTTSHLTPVAHLAAADLDPDRPLPAAVLADPGRSGCAWWVVDAPHPPHAAHPHAA
jgi:hypothetical protein